ncbi:hypothetical protein SERLA73DRAFT_176884 [Serpula lacrymans var. lacrymans S7.3]|uniref:AB hydrolase-1 domain-containing protein n=2 Tax=Serpula lacrymans var. lacrymans TaxID=341189 RepID=F8PQD0_SERL3|nr:uncharacterized protein SERLADRAFT_460187 [Serpula lacrymans var. lacrymans S7.9]EGO01543.1 hypothetical protein SERLA73DRAFT_176884 [Serpula lacrymans var. lacrymans S7.3]EGO27197.1 hypothetical protein SERLADRAFT_460187 [Serpula lacrymans var. lacrymans S7.9]
MRPLRFLGCLWGLLSVQALRFSEGGGTLHTRRFFFVGGSYVKQGKSEVVHGQMYVERLTPAKVTQDFPILFIHGLGMTGSNLINTPDGRAGWADYFLAEGYEVYLVDQPGRGRSAWKEGVDGNQITVGATWIESHFTATRNYGLWPQASLHTQWPGNGTVGDPIFDEFYKSVMPSLVSSVESSLLVTAAGSNLLDIIGPVILITHSQSGQFGWPLADARPSKVKAIVALEPSGPPFDNPSTLSVSSLVRPYGLTEIPIAFDPPISSPADLNYHAVKVTSDYTCYQQVPPARQMVNLVDIPVLVVTAEASYHAVYDDCTVQFLAEAGVNVKHVQLEDVGIRGNGHMIFMEKNSLQIAEDVINRWLQQSLTSSCLAFDLCYASYFEFSQSCL